MTLEVPNKVLSHMSVHDRILLKVKGEFPTVSA